MGYYRTWASFAVLIGINLAASLFHLSVETDLVLANHIVEAAMALAIVTFLVDLRMINGETQKNYFR